MFCTYKTTLINSFDNIPNWINFIRNIETTTLVLCGNKIDITEREVKKEDGEALAQKEGIAFFEASAKTGEGIKNMFYSAIANLPTFAEKNPNKENLIKELLQENGVENAVGGIKPQEPNQPPAQNINVNGQVAQVNNSNNIQKRKNCGC